MNMAKFRAGWLGLGSVALLCVSCGPLVACGGGSQSTMGTPSPPPPPPPPPPTPTSSVTVSCAPAAIVPYGTSQCTANVQGGGSSTVNWTASGGTISSNGSFTAPGAVGGITITATAQVCQRDGDNLSAVGAAVEQACGAGDGGEPGILHRGGKYGGLAEPE